MFVDVGTLSVLTALCLALMGLILFRPQILRHTPGKVLALVVFLPLPLMVTWVGGNEHLEHSKSTEFCNTCHMMEDYGKSLFIDDTDYLPAWHYQNNFIPRDKACFTCHTSYTMYGDFQAKMTGQRHVWVYLRGPEPKRIELYEDYNNRECLHCHGGARIFENGEMHVDILDELRSNETSCLECHEWIHGIEGINEHELWEPES